MQDAEIAAIGIDQQRCGHSNRLPGALQVLEDSGLGIGIIGKSGDAIVTQPGARLVEVARVDVDRHDLECGASELGLKRIERRHFLAARCAPGSPQVEQNGLAAPVCHAGAVARAILEGQGRQLPGSQIGLEGRDVAA